MIRRPFIAALLLVLGLLGAVIIDTTVAEPEARAEGTAPSVVPEEQQEEMYWPPVPLWAPMPHSHLASFSPGAAGSVG